MAVLHFLTLLSLKSLFVTFAFTIPSRFQNYHKNAYIISKEWNTFNHQTKRSPTSLYFFDKVFEESGPLGKGVTVGKIQVSLETRNKASGTIFEVLEDEAKYSGNSNEELAEMAKDICIGLMRNSDNWRGACSDFEWFKVDDAGKAESLFNDWSNREAAKFEKEYIPKSGDEETNEFTYVVVSLVIEIQGDQTNFEGAGYSLSKTKDVLSSIASDAMVDEGYCVNAVEVFWTPSARNEVMARNDVILDFPELIDL